MDIQVLLICVFIGVCVRAISGLNPLAMFGAIFIVSLVLPAFFIPLPSNPNMAHKIANTLDLYIANLTQMLTSVITGELLGIFAKDILILPKNIIDHIRTWL